MGNDKDNGVESVDYFTCALILDEICISTAVATNADTLKN